MSIFSYHLVKLPLITALKMMFSPINPNQIDGLIHAETMSAMILGSPIFSKSRIFNREIVVFAQWKNENVLDDFLRSNAIGKQIAKGWHIRLEFLRQWGNISGFKIPSPNTETANENNPVIAITIARMKYTQIPRFLRWGRPVEKQVRDNNGSTLSLASIRYPNTISTFSIWKSQKEMTDMVHGHSKMSQPKRHLHAMKERERKDFHFEFTTLRFKPLTEFGPWNNKQNYIPIKTELI
ncbi:hypothetical protein [Sphingobacterium sp. BIGb0165]|uniref:hypothetical protein n=1 Tax=Sphingobacterium sp. BIGb0165 TaxID=2940615 RepID=UPI00216998A8|nr:hypothetical protein [Sphingobacterium sp. BIGb0165]MCS4224565.1 hypothetical protein [Sphingobacterium sp. BIGb0165]